MPLDRSPLVGSAPRFVAWPGMVAMLALTAAACTPAELGEDESALEEDADSRDDAIVGGTVASSYPEAVLVDMAQGGQLTSICSGSLVAPRVVLTAGHCIQGYDGWVVKAPFAGNQRAVAVGAETFDWTSDGPYVATDQHDLGLVYLAEPIELGSYPKLANQRVAWNTQVRNIGRIDDGVASSTSLFLGPAVPVRDGAAVGFPFAYRAPETIQSGDSGGPVVVSGTHTIVAVNSGAGGGTQVLARVDLLSDWLAERIAAHEATPTTDGCGSLDYAGACDGTRVAWCENGNVQSIDCASAGKTCGYRQQAGYYDCL
jgi:hypothetical protein